MRLVLASASPRRADLLRAAGIEFETLIVDVDETLRAGEEPAVYVRRLAMEKCEEAVRTVGRREGGSGVLGPPEGGPYVPPGPDVFVLGADTAVVVDDEILGKPVGDRDAERMLRRLSGRRHHVLTGISLRRNAIERGRVESTAVDFAPLSDGDIAWYVASGEGHDKAGGYAIQGFASRFITRIEGSYSNVVGLPVHTVFALLRELA